jgi:hypothetical protein
MMDTTEAKQLITSSQDISSSAKLVQHDLLMLLERTLQFKDVTTDLDQITDSILIELQRARELLAESIEIANNLYQAGLDQINGGES